MNKSNEIRNLMPVDFSLGIRSDVINTNFEITEEMIKRERLSIAGHGVASGLNISINGFNITTSSGALIDVTGAELYIKESILTTPKPRLTYISEEAHTVNEEGVIALKHIPYSSNREHVTLPGVITNGLQIKEYGKDNLITPIAISDNLVAIGSENKGKLVKVSYYYTNKRYDTVYIDRDNKVKIVEGTTSYSPSIPMPEDSAYILAVIEVNPYINDELVVKKAGLLIKEDLRGIRNLYTDKDNNLYICGTPFDDLQIIHMKMPIDPYENQLWYDIEYNKLKVWKTVDGISSWVNVNDTTIVPVLEKRLWTPEENPDDLKTFMFHNEKEHYMKFIPNRGELEIFVDQGVLHSDQYKEITIEDLKTDNKLKQLAISKFGYSERDIANVNQHLENYGIGFMFSYAIDKPSYIEARTTHRVLENPIATRFQRSASFSSEGYQVVRSVGTVFETTEPYRCGENQLEVYIDGAKMIKGIDFTEGADVYDNGKPVEPAAIPKGTVSYAYKILRSIPSNSIIHYKITTNIYSYDHIESMIEGFKAQMDTIIEEAKQTVYNSNQSIQETDEVINAIQDELCSLKENNNEHDLFVKKTDMVDYAKNVVSQVESGLVKGLINKYVTKTSDIVTVPEIGENDFINVYDVSGEIPKLLLRNIGSDNFGSYCIVTDDDGMGQILFKGSHVKNGTPLYITGFLR